LGRPYVLSNSDIRFGGFRRSLVLRTILAGGFQSFPNQKNAENGDDGFQPRDDEHPQGPFRSPFFGVSATLAAIIAWWFLGIRSLKRASNALNLVLDGSKIAWLRVGCWLATALLSGGPPVGMLIYWLALYAPA
jgi:hypothetical protein